MPAFPEVLEAAMRIGVAPAERGGQIFAAEAEALYRAMCQAPPKTALVELGCYRGRSTVILAAAAAALEARLIAIDNFRYRKFGASCRECVLRNVRDIWPDVWVFAGDTAAIPPILGPAIGKVGGLFIDSDHRDEHIHRELDCWLPLLAPRAIVAVHDYHNPTWPTLPGLLAIRLPNWKRIEHIQSFAAFRKP